MNIPEAKKLGLWKVSRPKGSNLYVYRVRI